LSEVRKSSWTSKILFNNGKKKQKGVKLKKKNQINVVDEN